MFIGESRRVGVGNGGGGVEGDNAGDGGDEVGCGGGGGGGDAVLPNAEEIRKGTE